jgi:crossover junction endodeoxyribonuclease RuvC
MAIILGIDPGSRVTGYGVIRSYGNRLEFLDCGVVRAEMKSHAERLKKIFDGITQVVEKHSPTEVAIEEVFVGRNASSALKLGQARGAAMTACLQYDICMAEYSARSVKSAVTGSGGAEKQQVQHMVRAILNFTGDLIEDAADGLAIAVCHANTSENLIRLTGAKSFSRKRIR